MIHYIVINNSQLIICNDIGNAYWIACRFCLNSCNHHVNITSDELISSGQRIYIFGSMSSKPFSLDDGRLRQKVTIKSKYVRLRGHERNEDIINDQNNVKILAKITSNFRHTDNYSLFTLESNHIPKYVNA